MHGGYHNKILGVAICSTDIATEDIWLPYAYRISQRNMAADLAFDVAFIFVADVASHVAFFWLLMGQFFFVCGYGSFLFGC